MALLTPYSLENDLLDRKNRALELFRQGRAVDPLTVSRIMSISRNWPSLRPGAVVGLAQAGLDEHADVVREAARLSVKQQSNEAKWGDTLPSDEPEPEPDKPEKKEDKGKRRTFEELTTEQVFDAYRKLQSDASRYYDDRISKRAFMRDWGVDPENASGLNAAVVYELSTRNQKEVRALFKNSGWKANKLSESERAAGAEKAMTPWERYTGAREQTDLSHDLAGRADLTDIPYIGELFKAAKPVVREAAVVANTGYESVNAMIRNVAAGGTPTFNPQGQDIASQTTLGQQVIHGLSAGDGYLPDPESPAGQAAVQSQRAAAPTIGGHAFSLGRGVANQFFEPDTEPFNVLSGLVDAGVAYKADPASSIIGTIGDVNMASKRFIPQATTEATGAFATSSRVMVGQTKADFLNSEGARSTAMRLMDEADGSPSRMMRAINNKNLASPTFPIQTVHGQRLVEELADASSTRDVERFFDAYARATEVQTPFKTPGVTYKLKQALDSRVFAAMPRGTIADLTDKNSTWKTLDDIMRAGNVPLAQRDAALDTYIRSDDQFAGITAVSDTISNVLIHNYKVDPDKAKQLGSFFKEAHITSRSYDVDQMTGVERIRPGIGIAGEGHVIPAPSLISEGLNSPVQIPNLRELRRAASDFNYITATAPWKVSQTALRAPQAVWSPLQILSARQGVRDFAETQVNLAARGSINFFTDPADTIGLIVGANADKRLATYLEKVPGINASYLYDPEGYNIVSKNDDLLMHSVLQFSDPDVLVTRGYVNQPITHPGAPAGFVEQLGRMHADPVMKGVAEAPNPYMAKEWFWSGPGKELRLERAEAVKGIDEHNMAKLASGELTAYEPIGDIANDRAAADRYLEGIMFSRLRDVTGGHQELLDAVRTGKLGGRALYKTARSRAGEDLSIVDEGAVKRAGELLAGGFGPRRSIPVRELLPKDSNDIQAGAALTKRVVDAAFHGIVDLPDKELNRIPTWVQLQWKAAIENAPWLSADDLSRLKGIAADAKISKRQMAQLARVRTDLTETRRLTLAQLTKLAKYNAADEMKSIVHDLKSRSQFFDMVKFLIPFGDAFRLVATRMVKLARDEPQVVRRLQQFLQEAHEPGSGTINQLMGDPIAEGQPLFHDDPRTGEEVVIFPGSTAVNQALWDLVGPGNPVPLPMVGRVSGFNMLSDIYPGFGGPVVSIAGRWLLPEGSEYDTVRDIVFPYGGDESQGLTGDILGPFIPSWASKVFQGPPDQRALASEVNLQLKMLGDSGDYDLKDPRDLARMADDARENAYWVYMMRGIAQFSTPGAPSFEYNVRDKDGRLMAVQILSKKIQEHGKGDYDKGLKWLFENFGRKNIFASQSSSVAMGYSIPVSRKGLNWAREHPDVKEKFPLVYGFFAPQGKDIDGWMAQFEEGERRPLTAEEQIAQAENRLGFYAYENKKDEILKSNGGRPLTEAQWDWLRDFRADLKKEFPGFDTFLASPFDSRKRRESAIGQLEAAAKNPTVAGTDAGRGLAQYLQRRSFAIDDAKKHGLATPFQAQRAAGVRQWLRDEAAEIIDKHPQFRPIWEQVFSNELAKDVK